jgi:hypothetical protein
VSVSAKHCVRVHASQFPFILVSMCVYVYLLVSRANCLEGGTKEWPHVFGHVSSLTQLVVYYLLDYQFIVLTRRSVS